MVAHQVHKLFAQVNTSTVAGTYDGKYGQTNGPMDRQRADNNLAREYVPSIEQRSGGIT